MRDDTSKLRANHHITGDMKLAENVGGGPSWDYHCHDASDGEPKQKTFAIRFANPGKANEFKTAFEAATQINVQKISGK
jgi:hypothetical protein